MNLIAAIALNGVIGNKGKVPFKIAEDIRRFKYHTKENIVIMGAKTFYDDLNARPLEDRTNIVISSKAQDLAYKYPFDQDKLYIVSSPKESVELATQLCEFNKQSVWVIGGASIYTNFLSQDLVDQMYITHVHAAYDGDTYFHIDWSRWQVEEEEHHLGYSFVNYKKTS